MKIQDFFSTHRQYDLGYADGARNERKRIINMAEKLIDSHNSVSTALLRQIRDTLENHGVIK